MPRLGFILGLVAAAQNLSFTKAAGEPAPDPTSETSGARKQLRVPPQNQIFADFTKGSNVRSRPRT
jgi:hypothetical protein